jgi:hypothetical protein
MAQLSLSANPHRKSPQSSHNPYRQNQQGYNITNVPDEPSPTIQHTDNTYAPGPPLSSFAISPTGYNITSVPPVPTTSTPLFKPITTQGYNITNPDLLNNNNSFPVPQPTVVLTPIPPQQPQEPPPRQMQRVISVDEDIPKTVEEVLADIKRTSLIFNSKAQPEEEIRYASFAGIATLSEGALQTYLDSRDEWDRFFGTGVGLPFYFYCFSIFCVKK